MHYGQGEWCGHSHYIRLQRLQALGEVVVKPKREHYRKKDNPAVEFVRRMIESRDNYSSYEKDFWQRERYEKTTFALNNFD